MNRVLYGRTTKRYYSPRMQGAVVVGLTPEEKAEIYAVASSAGHGLSTWFRSLALAEFRRLGIPWPAQQKTPQGD